ncbi:FAD/NAD(P)-binding domain-containing protein [Sistotremastrum suecicum HHB10207 ss-3]|uniref:FAD/NAD(P)-binding domain-containing protein n=1 Tax=Sistotremastrum suecicum HHB10207 ss-3 TaxID=1314776 RepID=A0A166A0A6_9AGAM|nr:FAD/NAD(P)-binding domain-containing protein [Sistotremastrum suecicum HHB10207 ss-3]
MPSIVIIGAGGFGAPIARALSSKLDPKQHTITLISSRDFFTHLPGTLRMIVTPEGELEKRVLMPLDKLFVKGNGNFVLGTVTEVRSDKDGRRGWVVLESGDQIYWDILVLAPGSSWEAGLNLPVGTKNHALSHVEAWRSQFAHAEKIVLAGGGSVGIELAGELRDLYPNKKITIVHGGPYLLNEAYPLKFRKDIELKVRKRNIELILQNHLDQLSPVVSSGVEGTYVTREGKPLVADLVVPTRGGKPNTSFLSSLPGASLTASGHVKILPTMQLPAFPHILAAGDVIDFPEQKQVGKAGAHQAVIVPNVMALLKELETGQAARLKEYQGTFEAIVITNGKYGGSGYLGVLWGILFGDWLASLFKSRWLLIGLARSQLGL